jgi:hypothetical protein
MVILNIDIPKGKTFKFGGNRQHKLIKLIEHLFETTENTPEK